jgi:hypothetical protein
MVNGRINVVVLVLDDVAVMDIATGDQLDHPANVVLILTSVKAETARGSLHRDTLTSRRLSPLY